MTQAPPRTLLLDTLEHDDQTLQTHEKTALKRARAKDLSYHVASGLYGEAIRTGDNEPGSGKLYERKSMARYYGRALDCMGMVVQDADNRLRTHYCGARCCVQCNRIRTAHSILAYEDPLSAWGEDMMFGTVTLTNCTEAELPSVIDAMTKTRYNAIRSIRRTHGLEMNALFKLEVTYNRRSGLYHPHYHYLANGREQSDLFNSTWVDRAPRNAEPWCQDIRQADPGSFREVMKYATKIITDDKQTGTRSVHLPSLHVTYRTLKGKKTLQPFGITPTKVVLDEDSPELAIVQATHAFKRLGETVNWKYVPDYQDWIDEDTGECFTGYERPDSMDRIISTITGKDPRPPYPLDEDAQSE